MGLPSTFASYARFWRLVAVLALGNVVFGVGDAAMTRWSFAAFNGVCAVFFGAVALQLRALDREESGG